MRTPLASGLAAMLLAVLLLAARPAYAQSELPGPITALWSDGERLLIGQAAVLIEAEVVLDSISARVTRNLARGELHDFAKTAASPPFLLALSTDGLTILDDRLNVLGFLRGSGQRVAASVDRAYVAVRGAGVRVVGVGADGGLLDLGLVPTAGPALDVWPGQADQVWVAEGEAGVRLYDVRDPGAPSPLLWFSAFSPAAIVRTIGADRLLIAHGDRLSLLVLGAAPRLLGQIVLTGDDAQRGPITDLAIAGERIFATQTFWPSLGAEVVAINILPTGELREVGRFGSAGTGERLALHGNEVFVSSAQGGLRRYSGGTLVGWWAEIPPLSTCAANAPTDPQPADQSETTGSSVTLAWRASCAAAYELRINGTPIATLDAAELERIEDTPSAAGPSLAPAERERYTHRLSVPPGAVVVWQVVAIDAAGRRASSPLWRFEIQPDGWMATPAPPPHDKLVYVPPLVDLRSPESVALATCFALLAGISVIVGAAWWLGLRAQRRSIPRL